MKFVLASHNKGKLKEMAAILGELGIEVASLPEGAPEPEENGATFEENARIKAKAAADFTGLPAIADDSGLCVDALGGAPGIRSARYCEGTDADRNAFLLKNMEGKEDRACRFVCAIACVLADGETVTAPQAGNVVFAGTLTLTGGTVVIDHGCGVKSYLYGLETVGVERGQSVSAGDPLGTAGTAHNLIYELRIGSKSTDPQTALDGNSGLQFREAE